MNIEITNGAFYIFMGLLLIMFMPHIYLILIFATMSVIELIDKFIKFTSQYIMPMAFVLLFYYTVYQMLGIILKEIVKFI